MTDVKRLLDEATLARLFHEEYWQATNEPHYSRDEAETTDCAICWASAEKFTRRLRLPDYEAAVDALEGLLERYAHVDKQGKQKPECEGDSLFRCVAHDAIEDDEADAAFAAIARLREQVPA